MRYLGVVFNLDAKSLGHIVRLGWQNQCRNPFISIFKTKNCCDYTENFSVFGGNYLVVSYFIIMSLQAPGPS